MTWRARGLALVPLIALAVAGVIFYAAVTDGPARRASAMVGRAVPDFELGAVDGLDIPGLASGDLAAGKPVLLNFWASWCPPCRLEHPILMALASRGDVVLVGIDYKDAPEDAARYLKRNGNPFSRIGADVDGRTVIEWGVSGVPETFLISPDGKILAHEEGVLTEDFLIRAGIAPLARSSAGPS